jgi:hypothetical protein
LPSEIKAAILLRALDEPHPQKGQEALFDFSRIEVNSFKLPDQRPKSWARFAQKIDVQREGTGSLEKLTDPVVEAWDKLGMQAPTFRLSNTKKSTKEIVVVLELQTSFHRIIMERAREFGDSEPLGLLLAQNWGGNQTSSD